MIIRNRDEQGKPVAAGLKRLARTGIACGFIACATTVFSANWYVRPTAAGAATGVDWNNAWSISTLNSRWSSVSPGDTIWLAGGTYTTSVIPTKSGVSGNPINIKRVLATDAVPAAAAGWSASFDSQVLLYPPMATGFNFTTSPNGSYLAIDGRINYGIKVITDDFASEGGSCVHFNGAGPGNITFNHIEFQGPGREHIYTYNQGVIGFAYGGANNVTFSNCAVHDAPCLVFIKQSTGIIFDHCYFYDNDAGNTVAIHPNMFDVWGSTGIVFRYCDMTRWAVEGFQMWGNAVEITVHGCVFHDGQEVHTCFWPSANGNSSRKLTVYNNTFVNVTVTSSQGVATGETLPFTADSTVSNNIYYNASWYSGCHPTQMDYDFSNGSTYGSHSINGGSNPFVNLAAGDYRLVATVGATYPRNKGAALASTFSTDVDGRTRGADGAWDMGAFEYGVAGPVTNPVSLVSPSSLTYGALPVGATSNLTLTVQNAGAGTLAGTATVAAPFSIVSGGTYSLGSNQSQTVTIRYSPTQAGTHSQTVTFTGGGGATALVSGSAMGVLGSAFNATDGVISAPFAANPDGSISQGVETSDPVSGGRAVYLFSITTAGDYTVQAVVNSPDTSANSFFLNIDGEPQDPTMIWDVSPTTIGYEQRAVSWRGAGTPETDEFSPKVFTLTQGRHQLILQGREANGMIQSFALQLVSPRATPPAAPLNVRVVARN